ncbi:hypothetical protein [Pseudomonas sp. 6D_7.1_Bac1]|nr:hypothetical protein [Pseudomonas sp. 6D_7.1_Bac1]MCU1750070.1 hypothetical protein [Pseudomonas sp. 6D_7.1_Bac1]
MNITIFLLDRAGRSFGQLTLPATTLLVDLLPLRNLGTWRVGMSQ